MSSNVEYCPVSVSRVFYLVMILQLSTTLLAFDETPLQGSLSWYAAKAKIEGRTDLTMTVSNGIPVRLNTWEEAFANYTIVVATPVATTVNTPDGYHIWTWYKLRLIDTLKEHPRPEKPEFAPTPEAFKPLGRDEFVTYLEGGTLRVDGVEIIQPLSPIPALTLGERYLLFVLPTSTNRSGVLHAGKNAVFHVSPADELEPVSSVSTNFQKDLLRRSGKSLGVLKQIVETSAEHN